MVEWFFDVVDQAKAAQNAQYAAAAQAAQQAKSTLAAQATQAAQQVTFLSRTITRFFPPLIS